MSSQLLKQGLAGLEFARSATLGFLEDIPGDRLTHQPAPGCNHALWIMGHLASTDDYFLSSLAKKPSGIPEEWSKLFGMGSKPVADAKAYPPVAEVRSKLSGRREDLIAWLKSMSEDQLLSPLPEELRRFAPNYAGLCVSLAWHEGLHAGQLTVIRRSLGLEPKFG